MADKVLPAQPHVKEPFASSITKGLNSIGALAIVIGLITALFLHLSGRIDGVNQRIDGVNQRIDGLTTEMNQRFEAIDKRLDKIEKAILMLTHEIKNKQ